MTEAANLKPIKVRSGAEPGMVLRFQHQLTATAESEVSEDLLEFTSSDREFPIAADWQRVVRTRVLRAAAELLCPAGQLEEAMAGF